MPKWINRSENINGKGENVSTELRGHEAVLACPILHEGYTYMAHCTGGVATSSL